jgi:hypothetical protein
MGRNLLITSITLATQYLAAAAQNRAFYVPLAFYSDRHKIFQSEERGR